MESNKESDICYGKDLLLRLSFSEVFNITLFNKTTENILHLDSEEDLTELRAKISAILMQTKLKGESNLESIMILVKSLGGRDDKFIQ